MNSEFAKALLSKLSGALYNNFNDNYDSRRYGPVTSTIPPIKQKFVDGLLKKKFISGYDVQKILRIHNEIAFNYGRQLSQIYDLLADENSKQELIDIIAFRILGHKKIRLRARKGLEERRQKENVVFDKSKSIRATYLESDHEIFQADLQSLGFPIKLYATGIIDQFISEQYNYQGLIKVESGDVVIDAGACYGDSSLYFAHLAGNTGKVLSVEFIPGNIQVIEENKQLNEYLKNVEVVAHPLWDEDDRTVYFIDRGPGSKVQFEDFEGAEGEVSTRTIDTIVREKGLDKVDFIKMDIEGAEPYALKGAIETIKKYKPKLAITNYHGMDDFVNIPLWISELGLGYKIYLGHPTIHWEESVIFAIVD